MDLVIGSFSDKEGTENSNNYKRRMTAWGTFSYYSEACWFSQLFNILN